MENGTMVTLAVLGLLASSSSSAGGYYYYSNNNASTTRTENALDGIYESDMPVMDDDMFKIRKVRIEIYDGKITLIYYNDKSSVVYASGCVVYTKNNNTLNFELPSPSEGAPSQKTIITIKDTNTLVMEQQPITLKRVSKDKFGCNKVDFACTVM